MPAGLDQRARAGQAPAAQAQRGEAGASPQARRATCDDCERLLRCVCLRQGEAQVLRVVQRQRGGAGTRRQAGRWAWAWTRASSACESGDAQHLRPRSDGGRGGHSAARGG